MKKLLFRTWPSGLASLGLLTLRVIVGSGLMLHGWPKIQNPFSWMGPESWAPGAVQALAAVTEVVGGLALIVGIATPVAALFVAGMMGIAATTVHIAAGQPFVTKSGPSWELAALYFGAAVTLLTSGAGRFSLDYLLFGRRDEPEVIPVRNSRVV